jgi:prephenate dehydrogenase
MIKLKKVSVIGMGLLGTSVTLSAKRELPGTKIVGYSHRGETRDKARQYEVANQIADSLEQAVKEADVVILATPIKTFQDYFKQCASLIKNGCIVTDVGSTKLLSHKWAAKYLPKTSFYVGSHPIAGSEKRGLEFARDDLLVNAKCILTRVPKTDNQSVEILTHFWSKLGCRVEIMTPAVHDRIFGMVSHLPHIAAAAMVNSNTTNEMRFAGKGFIDTTRVASGPPNIWTDIVMTNPKTCVRGIEKLITQLRLIQSAVEAGDQEKIEHLLSKKSKKRGELIQYKIDQKELF